MSAEHTQMESAVADPVTGDEVTFRRTTEPGSMVEVTMVKPVNVRFETLLAAVQLLQLEEE